MSEHSRYGNPFFYQVYAWLFGYNEKRYWKYRQRIVNPADSAPVWRKMLWLVYLKRAEAKNAASLGTAINKGAVFATAPILPHGIKGIFVSHGAKIGKNCMILQNAIIGSSKGKAPVIGDDVVIGAGATIVGNIVIGNNVNIGANCTVFKDVPDNTTVVCQAPRYLLNRTNPKGRRF